MVAIDKVDLVITSSPACGITKVTIQKVFFKDIKFDRRQTKKLVFYFPDVKSGTINIFMFNEVCREGYKVRGKK